MVAHKDLVKDMTAWLNKLDTYIGDLVDARLARSNEGTPSTGETDARDVILAGEQAKADKKEAVPVADKTEALTPAQFLNQIKVVVDASDMPPSQAKAMARDVLEDTLGLSKFTEVPADKMAELIYEVKVAVS